MKHFLLSALFLFSVNRGFSQVINPVSWTASYKALSATEGEIIIKASIQKGWHTYSQRPTTDGPIPTTFSFTPNKSYQLAGKTEESEVQEEYVEAFGAKVFQFSDQAEFKQKIKITAKGSVQVSFKVEYICCDDRTCLPPKTVDLNVKIQ